MKQRSMHKKAEGSQTFGLIIRDTTQLDCMCKVHLTIYGKHDSMEGVRTPDISYGDLGKMWASFAEGHVPSGQILRILAQRL
jgi:hypothetical protein